MLNSGNADYEGAANAAVIPQRDLARYTLMARFPNPVSAAEAMARLRAEGLAGDDTLVLGSRGDVVHVASAMTESDRKAVSSSARGVVWGMISGAAVGAITGIIILAIPPIRDSIGHVSAGGWLAAAIIGAIIGLILGGLVWGIAGLDRSQAGVDTYGAQVSTGETLLGSRATGERAGAIAEVLHSSGGRIVEQGLPPAMRRAM
ncbi:MAG: hypothetical protein ACYDCQ_12800 [Dehalococcoidia bacterium]